MLLKAAEEEVMEENEEIVEISNDGSEDESEEGMVVMGVGQRAWTIADVGNKLEGYEDSVFIVPCFI